MLGKAGWQIAMAVLLAGLPTAAFAVDGVILIDQNRALAGNVTPGDAPGFPVTISQPGSYRLSGNLTVGTSNVSAIVIAASRVVLDLNGFGAECNLVAPPSTIVDYCVGSASGTSLITVTNGSIRLTGSNNTQFEKRALDLGGTTGATVTNMRTDVAFTGGQVAGIKTGDNAYWKGNIIGGNGGVRYTCPGTILLENIVVGPPGIQTQPTCVQANNVGFIF